MKSYLEKKPESNRFYMGQTWADRKGNNWLVVVVKNQAAFLFCKELKKDIRKDVSFIDGFRLIIDNGFHDGKR